MTETRYKYRVFVACSAADRVWGEWLHARLEDFQFLKPRVDAPVELGPIYCDCEHSADHILPSNRTWAALQASEFLVVLCSPAAAASGRINSQIRRFKKMGRASRLIPVLLAAVPSGSVLASMPPELHPVLSRDRPLGQGRAQPVLTAQRNAKTARLQNVIAELLGDGRREIASSGAATHRSRVVVGRVFAGAVLALALTVAGGIVLARYELPRHEAWLNYTLAQLTALMRTGVAVSSSAGLPQAVTLKMARAAESVLGDLAGLGGGSPALRLRAALMQIELARLHRSLGDSSLERSHATKAHDLLKGLAAERPGNLRWRFDLSVVYGDLGDLLHAQNRMDEAFANYAVVHAIAGSLASDPAYPDRQHELIATLIKIGDASVARGSLDGAIENYDESLAISGRLAAADPRDLRWQQGRMLSYARMGDAWRLQGKLDEALESYLASRAIADDLASAQPGQILAQHGLARAGFGIAEILMLQAKPEQALAYYRANTAIAQRLAAADPANPEWQYHLGISHDRIGSLLEEADDFAAALAEYRLSLAAARRLQAADPDNIMAQRNVGVAHRHIGDVLFSLGDLAGALRAYEAERGVIGRLFAGSHSSDLALQYDLGASHARLASVLEARRDFIGAASEYEACLGIAKRLAAAERNSAHAQLNVAVAYRKLAEVHHLLGNSRQALSELRQGRDIVLALLAIAGTEPGTGELARFDNLISALEGRASTTSVLQSAAAHSGASPVLASALGPARMRIRRDEHQPSSHQN